MTQTQHTHTYNTLSSQYSRNTHTEGKSNETEINLYTFEQEEVHHAR